MGPNPSSYRVYLGRYLTWKKSHHHAIYVETEAAKGEGMIYHVVGNLLTGMELGFGAALDPLRSTTGVSKQHLGWITKENYHLMKAVCSMIPPPTAQMALDGTKLDLSQPIRHCQHWVAEAIDALKTGGLLDPLGPTDDPTIQLRKDD